MQLVAQKSVRLTAKTAENAVSPASFLTPRPHHHTTTIAPPRQSKSHKTNPQNKSRRLFCIAPGFSLYLPRNTVSSRLDRESGENPEQYPLLYFPGMPCHTRKGFRKNHCPKRREGAESGISQKTCRIHTDVAPGNTEPGGQTSAKALRDYGAGNTFKTRRLQTADVAVPQRRDCPEVTRGMLTERAANPRHVSLHCPALS